MDSLPEPYLPVPVILLRRSINIIVTRFFGDRFSSLMGCNVLTPVTRNYSPPGSTYHQAGACWGSVQMATGGLGFLPVAFVRLSCG